MLFGLLSKMLDKEIFPCVDQLVEQVSKKGKNEAKGNHELLKGAYEKLLADQNFKETYEAYQKETGQTETAEKYLQKMIKERLEIIFWKKIWGAFNIGMKDSNPYQVEDAFNRLHQYVKEFNKLSFLIQLEVKDFVLSNNVVILPLLVRCLSSSQKHTSNLHRVYGHQNQIMELLVKNGFDLDQEFKKYNDEVTCVLREAPEKTWPFLLTNLNANPNKRNSNDELPIAGFANKLSLEGVKTLIEHKSESTKVNSLEDSVLHVVVRSAEKLSPQVEALIAYLVKKIPGLLNMKNKAGQVPIEYAKSPQMFVHLLKLCNVHKQVFDEATKQNIMRWLIIKLNPEFPSDQQASWKIQFSNLYKHWESGSMDNFLELLQKEYPFVKKLVDELSQTEFKMEAGSIEMNEISKAKQLSSAQALQDRMARTSSGSPVVGQSSQVVPVNTTSDTAVQLPMVNPPLNRV